MRTDYYLENLDGIFSVRYKNHLCLPNERPHIHDEYEVMLVLSSGVHCLINGESYPVPQNSVLIFSNTDLHKIETDTGLSYERYVIYFRPEFIAHLSTMQTQLLECFYNRSSDTPWILPLRREQCAQLRSLLDNTIEVWEKGEEAYGHDLLLRMRLVELLISVNTFYRSFHGITDRQVQLDYRQFYEMLDYIHKNLDDKITLDSLSGRFFIQKRACSKMFHKATGVSPGAYILKCRIMKATDALAQGMRVEEVCGQVGFQNLSHFSRTFKKYLGVSPKQYSKQAEK